MKNYNIFVLSALVALSSSCKPTSTSNIKIPAIEVQGHRGDRGHFPENSLQAFRSAIDKGADVIELDVVISQDKKVVVSHEPFMSSEYVLLPDGTSLTRKTERAYNLYLMPYDSIRKFDIGSKGNVHFPEQQKMKAYKPLLSEMIDDMEAYCAKNRKDKPVRYNIEIKSGTDQYGISQPQPDVFVDLVMKIVKEKGIEKKSNIQSFDPQILNVLHKKYPKIKIAFLTGDKGFAKNLAKLDFKPQIYSPHYGLVDQALKDSVKALHMRLIPWTVNEEKDIDRMIELQVDGIITDYPEKVLKKL